MPKEDFKRFYFATKGAIRGYFKVRKDEIYRRFGRIHFDSETWTEIKPIPQKPFQGFKYMKNG